MCPQCKAVVPMSLTGIFISRSLFLRSYGHYCSCHTALVRSRPSDGSNFPFLLFLSFLRFLRFLRGSTQSSIVSLRPHSPATCGPASSFPRLRILISSPPALATYARPITASATPAADSVSWCALHRPARVNLGWGLLPNLAASGHRHSLAHNPGCWLCVIGCMGLRLYQE